MAIRSQSNQRAKVMTKIFIAGHNGMVGSAICRQLKDKDVEVITASRKEVDLINPIEVNNFFAKHKFDQVYLAAAKVGGIHANDNYPAEFIYQNLMIQNNVIHSAFISGVDKLLFLGSSCIYPKLTAQPISENQLLSGQLEETNEPYAIAKIAGIKMCESYNRQYNTDFRSVMPTNLYGPQDNFHPLNSHVVPGLMVRFHEAKVNDLPSVTAWGSGNALREFLYVDDMASACVFVMGLDRADYWSENRMRLSHVNVGSGIDCSIRDLTELIAKTVSYRGKILWDNSLPDGTPRKLLDTSTLKNMGWEYKINLIDGLSYTYKWYKENIL